MKAVMSSENPMKKEEAQTREERIMYLHQWKQTLSEF